MGYLDDVIPFGIGYCECPEVYQYAIVVTYTLRDEFVYPRPADALGELVAVVVPDVEDWQYSVVRSGHVKFRFRRRSDRDAFNASLVDMRPEIHIASVTLENPPDRI